MTTRGLGWEKAQEAATNGAALIYVPPRMSKAMISAGAKRGDFRVLIPEMDDEERWLRKTCNIARLDRDIDGRWVVPEEAASRIALAAVDEFSSVLVVKDAWRFVPCGQLCKEAEGPDCECSCMGLTHGSLVEGKNFMPMISFEVLDLPNASKRSFRWFGHPRWDGPVSKYAGELAGQKYVYGKKRVDLNWPFASQFFCEACGDQAEVWDHCHVHGDVRAPLCDPCNRWMWSGWAVPPRQLKKVDLWYYGYCTGNRRTPTPTPQSPCSP